MVYWGWVPGGSSNDTTMTNKTTTNVVNNFMQSISTDISNRNEAELNMDQTLTFRAPYAKMSVRALDNGFQVVRFTELSQNLHTSSVTFTLTPPAGINATSVTGYVNDADVYGAIGEPVTFHDRDASFTVNRGDYFVINASAAGTETGGWTIYVRNVGLSGTTELAAIPLPATV